MSHDFLGTGWSFPTEPQAPHGPAPVAVELAHYEESVRQAIWIILSTARGERVMRPTFGCGIHSLVFALDNPSTAGLVEHEVEQALLYWEPRINVIRVTVISERAGDGPSHPELMHEYQTFSEGESRRRLRSLPHAAREEMRLRALRAGVKAAGPGEASLPPDGVEGAMLRGIAAELPSFERWRAERHPRVAGPVLLITVDYAIKATNSRFNVVYPFYVERGAPLSV